MEIVRSEPCVTSLEGWGAYLSPFSPWPAQKHSRSPMLPSRCPDARHSDNICDEIIELLHSNSDEEGDGFEIALADDTRSKAAIPILV